MSDREWQDGDDSALYDSGYQEGVQDAVNTLRLAIADANNDYQAIVDKYFDGGFYSSDDSSEQDYLEGKIAGLEIALALLEGSNK